MTDATRVRARLQALADPVRATGQRRFFKTGVGQYGEGDIFWGIRNAEVRSVAKEAKALPLPQVEALLEDPVHEVRLCALLLLVEQFRRADAARQKGIVALYLRRTDRVNNWDLVDLSASLLGQWLWDKDRSLLGQLAEGGLWEQRIAVVSTLEFIRRGDFAETLRLCRRLLRHPHDLMHKALGWMLREVGKRDEAVLRAFIEQHGVEMPRTMLRYAIERLPREEREALLIQTRRCRRPR